jgi:hypothetical protein
MLAPDAEVKGSLNPKLKGKPLKRYDVQYSMPARQIEFLETPEHTRKGALEFELAAYDVNGTMLNSLSQTIQLPLKQEEWVRLQGRPFQFFQQLDLPIGDVFLRVGVHDVTSDKIGTLEIPLPVSKKAGPQSASAAAPASP